MSSKLIPKDPEKVMVIRDVVPRTITTLSVPFLRFGRIKIGGRGTIGKTRSIYTHMSTKANAPQCACKMALSPSSRPSH
jgi:hypothetical protein